MLGAEDMMVKKRNVVLVPVVFGVYNRRDEIYHFK